jgi:hypothetical protein
MSNKLVFEKNEGQANIATDNATIKNQITINGTIAKFEDGPFIDSINGINIGNIIKSSRDLYYVKEALKEVEEELDNDSNSQYLLIRRYCLKETKKAIINGKAYEKHK